MNNFLMFRDDIIFGKSTMRELHLYFTSRARSWVNRESIHDHIFPSERDIRKDATSHIKQFVNNG